MDADTVLPRTQLMKGDNEKTITELRATIAENEKINAPTGSQQFTIQQKFSIPTACLVLALIGIALGVSNRKDGKLAGFVVGIARDLRVLRAAVDGARRRDQRYAVAGLRAVDPQRRARHRRHRAGDLARRVCRSADSHQPARVRAHAAHRQPPAARHGRAPGASWS